MKLKKTDSSSGHALLLLRAEELGFLYYLKQAKVPLNEFEFDWSKIANFQLQLEKLIGTNYYLNISAKEAFKAYVRAYDSHHLKNIFRFKVPPAVDLNISTKKAGRPEKSRQGGGGFGYFKKLNSMPDKDRRKNTIYRQPANKGRRDNRQSTR